MANEVIKKFAVDGRSLMVVRGDITEESVDVVVNAANSHLAHGGGVAGAISRKGGPEIQRESTELVRKRGPVPVGSAVHTTGGRLKCRWVVHTVGPRWGEGDEERKLRSAVKSALSLADSLGAGSVALPAISTGIFGYPKDEGTKVIVEECVKFLRSSPENLKEVRLVAYDSETADFFTKWAVSLVEER